MDTYIGIITPDGVVESGRKKISLAGIEVKEYGFSRAVWQLCPESWKKPLGDDWEDVLSIIIKKWSPETYLVKERTIKKEGDFHYQFVAQASLLSRKIHKEHGADKTGKDSCGKGPGRERYNSEYRNFFKGGLQKEAKACQGR